jgi:hypothetical protein
LGYSAHQTDSRFRIPVANLRPALLAVKTLTAEPRHFSWVNKQDVFEAGSLDDVLDCWGWQIESDAKQDDGPGHIIGIRFTSEKIGDEDALFGALAPFVDAGSYIEMSGEDGDRWRWVFDSATCTMVRPKVTWEA